MTKHCKIKRKLKNDIETYADILNSPYISDKEKELMDMIYIQKYDYMFIGDYLGVSESTVKKRHKELIKKIGKILKAGL